MKSFLALPVFLAYLSHLKVQIIKQIVILYKDNPSKYKMQFWDND